MVRLTTILTAAVALSASVAHAGGWRVGNGDGLRLAFTKAKEHAVYITLRVQPRSLPAAMSAGDRDWLLKHKEELAGALAKTVPVWTTDARPACAEVTTDGGIELSYPTCRANTNSFDEAGQLLLHEAVHLVGGGEELADAVALAIYDAWRKGDTDWVATSQGPAARTLHSAVWADDGMIVYGGLLEDGTATNTGYKYDPASDRWTALPTAGAPARYSHQSVWTGSQLVIWGGYVNNNNSKVWQNTGAVWDSRSQVWTTLKSPYGPEQLSDLAIDERAVQTVVFTGKELIVFGGALVGGKTTGGIYNLETKQWRQISATGAPVRIAGHSAVWTDERMIVWGGLDVNRNRVNTGASYDPVSNTWRAISSANAPRERDGHTAIFTGSQMIVWSGFESLNEMNGSGGIYDVATDSWTPIATESVQARLGHTAVWTGSEMLVFGGKSKRLRTLYNAVSAFNPSNKSWRVVETTNAPQQRAQHAAAWTGSSMIVFGGQNAEGRALGTGGVFYP